MCVGGPVNVNTSLTPSCPLCTQLSEILPAPPSALAPPLLGGLCAAHGSAGGPESLLSLALVLPTFPAHWEARPPRPGLGQLLPGPRSLARRPACPGALLLTPHTLAPCPHSPWGIGSLGLCLDGGPRAPQEGLGSGAHAIVVVAVERGAVARGREGAMAPRGGSTPRWAQVEDPAGARDGRLPVGVGGGTGRSRDVREAAAEKGGSSAPARTPGPHPRGRACHLPGRGEAGGQGGRRAGHSQVRGVLLADVLLQDAGVDVGGLQGPAEVVACGEGQT